MDDKRIAKSKRAIHQAFISLLKSKPLNKITVAELSYHAEIGRGTFYLHYKDIYDLYEHIEKELCSKLVQIFDDFPPCENGENIFRLVKAAAEYLDKEKLIFKLLIRSDNNGNILRKLKDIFYDKMLAFHQELPGVMANDVHTQKYILLESIFVVCGIISVFEEWITNGLDMSSEEVSEILYTILLRFAVP